MIEIFTEVIAKRVMAIVMVITVVVLVVLEWRETSDGDGSSAADKKVDASARMER